MYHEGRSCVFSLKDLIDAGLYKLYPEFNDEIGKRLWTNRVKQLRSQWSTIRSTNEREIGIALSIALQCFTEFHHVDMSLMLLTLKNRNREDLAPLTSLASRPSPRLQASGTLFCHCQEGRQQTISVPARPA